MAISKTCNKQLNTRNSFVNCNFTPVILERIYDHIVVTVLRPDYLINGLFTNLLAYSDEEKNENCKDLLSNDRDSDGKISTAEVSQNQSSYTPFTS